MDNLDTYTTIMDKQKLMHSPSSHRQGTVTPASTSASNITELIELSRRMEAILSQVLDTLKMMNTHLSSLSLSMSEVSSMERQKMEEAKQRLMTYFHTPVDGGDSMYMSPSLGNIASASSARSARITAGEEFYIG